MCPASASRFSVAKADAKRSLRGCARVARPWITLSATAGAPALDPQPLIAQWLRGEVHAVTVSSGEGLANLAARLGETARTLLVALPVFVPHPRVAEQARALGVADVVVSGAADEDVLAALVAYFRRTG